MRENVKKAKKLNDKGFSLIGLIIVIVIMAILIGIVDTQFMPCIEKSRQAKDKQVLSSILTNATSAFAICADICEVGTKDQTIKIVPKSSGNIVADTTQITDISTFDGSGDVIKALIELMNGTDKLESKAGKKISSIIITRDSANKVTVSAKDSDGNTLTEFKDISSN